MNSIEQISSPATPKKIGAVLVALLLVGCGGGAGSGGSTATSSGGDSTSNTPTGGTSTPPGETSAPPPLPTTILPASPGSALALPSLDDERSTYTKWGWSWSASAEPGALTADPYEQNNSGKKYTVYDPGIHYDTEGDDLWTYTMMYRRTGNPVYLDRAAAWARYFKEDYVQGIPSVSGSDRTFQFDKAFELDHLYGWGLLSWYEHTCDTGTCDTAAATAAEAIGAELEKLLSDPKWKPGRKMATYGARATARYLLLATRLAEVTKKPQWVALRDRLIDLWIQSPDWDARGMYFVGEFQTDYVLGTGNYAAGIRLQSAFQVGVLAEAFYHAYRTTNRPELGERLVLMAQFVSKYGLDPTYQYTASWFGVKGDQPFHSYSAKSPVTFWDPVYTTSLVNTLVLGYKYGGDKQLYDRAKYFFNRGTKGIYGEPTKRAAADNVVHHFVDTKFASSTGYRYLDYNKGELQYVYLIFENGGL